MRSKVISLLIIAVVFGLSFLFTFSDEDSTYAVITDLDYSAVVMDEPGGRGKAIITERLTFKAHASSREYLVYELWRDLPEEYVDGVKVEYRVLSVKQVFEDGTAVIYKEAPNLYWWDHQYVSTHDEYGPGKWFHSKGPYDGNSNFECVLFYVDGLFRETVMFEIEYEMYNASLRYNDSSEFYVSLYSGDSIKNLKSVRGQFLFPLDIMPRAGNYDAYTYGTNSHSFPFRESATANPGYHTFSFELSKPQLKFRPYNRYIEFALISHGEDRHIFTQFAEVNDYYNTDMMHRINSAQADYEGLPLRYLIVKLVLLFVFIALAALSVCIVYLSDRSVMKKLAFYQPSAEIEYYREIPSDLDPCFAAALVFCRHRTSENVRNGWAAVMLSLVQKGYIDLVQLGGAQDTNPDNVKITILHRPTPPAWGQAAYPQNQAPPAWGQAGAAAQDAAAKRPLSPTEELYFNLIQRHSHNGELRLSMLQSNMSEDYSYTHSFVENTKHAIKSIGMSLGYFRRTNYGEILKNARGWALFLLITGCLFILISNLVSYQTRVDLAFGAFFILGGGLIASAALLYVNSRKYVLFTQLGVDEYTKWRGLYNFLDSDTLMNERTVIELALWEYYLIYATAFGISKKVIEALKVRCPNANMSPVLRNPYFRTRHFYYSSRTFRYTAQSASFTSRSGGWGGYGGGGRGGGGGGGGH